MTASEVFETTALWGLSYDESMHKHCGPFNEDLTSAHKEHQLHYQPCFKHSYLWQEGKNICLYSKEFEFHVTENFLLCCTVNTHWLKTYYNIIPCHSGARLAFKTHTNSY